LGVLSPERAVKENFFIVFVYRNSQEFLFLFFWPVGLTFSYNLNYFVYPAARPGNKNVSVSRQPQKKQIPGEDTPLVDPRVNTPWRRNTLKTYKIYFLLTARIF